MSGIGPSTDLFRLVLLSSPDDRQML